MTDAHSFRWFSSPRKRGRKNHDKIKRTLCAALQFHQTSPNCQSAGSSLLFLTSICTVFSEKRLMKGDSRQSSRQEGNNVSSAPSPNQYPVVCWDVRKLTGAWAASYSRGAPLHKASVKSRLASPHPGSFRERRKNNKVWSAGVAGACNQG